MLAMSTAVKPSSKCGGSDDKTRRGNSGLTDLIYLSPIAMQNVGAFEILFVLVRGSGVVDVKCSFVPLKFKPARILWAWQILGFAKTAIAHLDITSEASDSHDPLRQNPNELQRCVRFPEERQELATM